MSDFFEIHIDESNPSGKPGTFFLLGGSILSPAQQIQLHEKILRIRHEWGIPSQDVLKFHMKPMPGFTSSDLKSITSEVIDAVVKVKGVVIAYTVLTDIARKSPVNERVSKGLDQLVDTFSRKFLCDNNAYGTVCIDRRDGDAPFRDIERHFSKGHSEGAWPDRQFERVIHAPVTTSKSSFINSCVDIVLGSIQYCVNLEPSSRSWEAARLMYPRINQLLYRREDQLGRLNIRGNGILFSPKEVRSKAYQARYDEMIPNLTALLR